jgi:putative chitinase
MKLTEHFNLSEFTVSQEATRKRIDNTPDERAVAHLHSLAASLEQVRGLLGDFSLHISSGYRCIRLNRAIGSGDTSAHVLGYAADFTCSDFGTPLQVAQKIAESNLKFDQVINENAWVHMSIDPRNRRELLTAVFHADAKTTYVEGLM